LNAYYLFDFADVISLPQDMVCFNEMARLLQMDEKKFHESYWKHRRSYDLGQKGKDYWPLVAARSLEDQTIESLIALDCKGWGRMNPLTISYIEKLKSSDKKLGLLSNLPIDLVHFLREKFSFLSLFDHVFFSAEIQLAKPDREIYEYVLQKTSMSANEILFFDDREENLQGAKSVGMQTFLVTQESIVSSFR
jgi:putative hydrolase of the HAD superfamily